MDRKDVLQFVVGLTLAALGIFFLASLMTHSPNEGPFASFPQNNATHNACGVIGAYISSYVLLGLGWTSYLVSACLVFIGGILLGRYQMERFRLRLLGMACLLLSCTLIFAIMGAGPEGSFSTYRPEEGIGGVVGIVLAGLLYRSVGVTGAALAATVTTLTGVYLVTGGQLAASVQWMRNVAEAVRWFPMPTLGSLGFGTGGSKRSPSSETSQTKSKRTSRKRNKRGSGDTKTKDQKDDKKRKKSTASKAMEIITPDKRQDQEAGTEHGLTGGGGATGGNGRWELPSVQLFTEKASATGENEEAIRQKGVQLEETLGEFNIDASVERVQQGPVVTMYEIKLAAGTKLSKVRSLSDDLAIALKAPNVRIVAPLPGKSTIGVEVPNSERELVGMKGVMKGGADKAQKQSIPLFLGKDIGGKPVVMDLATAPHLLIAGATGSGKSVCINSMISSILMTRTPEEVNLLLLDPKGVELSPYKRLPHLISPILVDMKKASSVLKWACKKMDERYALLQQARVRDLHRFNNLSEKKIMERLDPDHQADLDDVPTYMPHVVIVVDELAELMMISAKEVENAIIRLSQKARAVGIHLICATQRPSADVVTGLIKANLPARIAFQVSSKVDSRTILDRNGAELLLGAGDMLLLPPGTSRLRRAQGTFISDEELEGLIQAWEEQGDPQFREEIQNMQEGESEEEKDELYDEAVQIVVESQRGSVSLLQRKLGIGYSRAARLIDMMEEAGIVGSHRGSKARKVLVEPDEEGEETEEADGAEAQE